MKVIDTNVISAFMYREVDERMIDWLPKQDWFSLFTITICTAEILGGLKIMPTGRKPREKYQSFEVIDSSLLLGSTLDFDENSALYTLIATN